MVLTRERPIPLLLVLCLGQVLLISAQVQSQEGVPIIKGVAFGTFARLQHATAAVSDAGRNVWTQYFALSGAARENEDLRRRIVELEAELQLERARSGQTTALEDALGLARTVTAPTLSARVIAGNPAPGSLNVVIDRGSRDGIVADMPVIAVDGVVGRVVGRPSANAAMVQLLVAGNAGAAAMLEGSGAGGFAAGAGTGRPMRLEYVSNLARVAPGERVLTSGLDGVYPQGFLIGTVEDARPGETLYQEIAVRPAVDFSHLEIVLVLLTRPQPAGDIRP
jgi:rod shape-determining protein MreC